MRAMLAPMLYVCLLPGCGLDVDLSTTPQVFWAVLVCLGFLLFVEAAVRLRRPYRGDL